MRGTRRMRAIIGLVVVGATLLFGSAAGAQTEDDEYANVISATINNPTPGSTCDNTDITVSVDDLQPGSSASFTLYSDPVPLGTTVADDQGRASLTFDLPAGTTIGEHEVVVAGTNSFGVADEVRLTINVVRCGTTPPGTNPGGQNPGGSGSGSGSGSGNLARTGTDLGAPLRIGVVVLAVGAALLLAARKRTAQA